MRKRLFGYLTCLCMTVAAAAPVIAAPSEHRSIDITVLDTSGQLVTGAEVLVGTAGSVEGYPYSWAMQEIATGWKWDEETLDLWITSTQDMIRGSTMFLRVEGAEDRKVIVDYLRKFAPYEG